MPESKPDKPEDDEDEPEPEPLQPERHGRYSLVMTSSGWFGIFDELAFSQTLISRNRTDAIRELARLNKPAERMPYSWRERELEEAA